MALVGTIDDVDAQILVVAIFKGMGVDAVRAGNFEVG